MEADPTASLDAHRRKHDRMERQIASGLAPVQGALPQGLRYGQSVAEGVKASRRLQVFTAENASVFSPVNQTIRIPVSSGAFLDQKMARLCFDLTNTTNTDAVLLDGGAQCVIQRLRVLSVQGVELERIESYGLLHTIVEQYTSDRTHMAASAILSGAPARCDDFAFFGSAGGGNNTVTNKGVTITADGGGAMTLESAGGVGYDQTQADRLDTGVKRHYEFPLHAGWFRPAGGKYLPPGASYVLELTLASGVAALQNAAGGANDPNYNLQNAELKIPAITVHDPAFNQRVQMMASNGVSWKALSFKNHINTSPGAAGQDVLQIADRSMSLRALISVIRKQTNVAARAQLGTSRRSIQYIDNYQFQVGSDLYPPAQVDIVSDSTRPAGGTAEGTRVFGQAAADVNVSEAYAEVQRAFGTFASKAPAAGLIGPESFAQSESNNGAGLIAVDLSAYTDSGVSSGIDTASQALPVSLRISKNACANDTLQVDSYAMCDIEFILMPDGSITSRH
jgi:hypothetical protein